jgi:hypothetical protein
MVFVEGALVQQHLSFAVEYKYAKGAVQQSFAMSFYFLHYAYLLIVLIDQYDFVADLH